MNTIQKVFVSLSFLLLFVENIYADFVTSWEEFRIHQGEGGWNVPKTPIENRLITYLVSGIVIIAVVIISILVLEKTKRKK